MKKIISVILAMVMVFSIGSIAAFATETYEVVFTEFPYDIAPYRNDYVGQYEGYEYGVDYWFTITNEDGTTTDIKGYPYSIQVEAGEALEFVVNIAEYIEPSSVKMMAFPVGAEKDDDFYNTITGDPNDKYYITGSFAGTYGIVPQKDMTICLSEFHLYNKAFIFHEFPQSEYYTANRLFMVDPDAVNPADRFAYTEWGNTEVAYENETFFFEVRIPKDGKYDYNYETYHVYYKDSDSILAEKHYLKKPASEKEGTEAINIIYAHDETETEWIDIYAIPNLPNGVQIKVANTVTYTLSMLADFLKDFDLANLDSIDLSTVDMQPILEFLLRLLNLIVKLLNSFGLNITLPDLVSA